MMLTLRITGDLGADDAPRVGLRPGPAHSPNMPVVNPLDLECAGARTIVRADAGYDVERQESGSAVVLNLEYYNDGLTRVDTRRARKEG
jgi:hypothetical protein